MCFRRTSRMQPSAKTAWIKPGTDQPKEAVVKSGRGLGMTNTTIHGFKTSRIGLKNSPTLENEKEINRTPDSPSRSRRLKCALHLSHVFSPAVWLRRCLCKCSDLVKLRPQPSNPHKNFRIGMPLASAFLFRVFRCIESAIIAK